MWIRLVLAFAVLVSLSVLSLTHADDPAPAVTFAEHIAPLVFEHCAACHRPGEAAPFSLLSFQSARKHAETMLQTMEERYMPPWHPEPGHGVFVGARRLTEEQIKLFRTWVNTGMAEGDPGRTPPVPKFPEGWRLGQPDLIVTMDRPFEVPARGPDIYQNFVIPLGLNEDKWVTAVEFRASAPAAIHHVLYLVDDSGRARRQSPKEGQPGFPGMAFRPTGSLGGWAVGATPMKLPSGLAYPLPKGADLVLQTHFHLTGKPEKELITVGLYFADRPPGRTLVNLQLPPAFGLFSNLDIPAGQRDYRVADRFTLPVDVDVVAVNAHAHYLGKVVKADAALPDGNRKPLFYIKDWDFNWQGQYQYREFVRLPKGSVIHASLTWDNSADNPRNPNLPPVRVRWGESTNDEMGSIRFLLVAADESDAKRLQDAVRAQVRQAAIIAKLRGDTIEWERFGIDASKLVPQDAPKSPMPRHQQDQRPHLDSQDVDGKEHKPLDVGSAKAHVLFFVSHECPIANSYAPEITAIANDFTDQEVRFFLVHADRDLSVENARKHAKEFGLALPVLIDKNHRLVSALGATRTPEAVILLADGTVGYRGRIDDLFPGLGKKRHAPVRRDLREALAQILAGQPVTVPRTEAVGCTITDTSARR
jgi:hypothetical protein